MDSNDLEKERGITILAKNCARSSTAAPHINIVDTRATPTSAARSSACCRWSTACCCWSTRSKARCPDPLRDPKALALGLKPIVVINKIDRPGSRPTGSSTTPSTCSTSSAPPTSSSTSHHLRLGAQRWPCGPQAPGTDMRPLFRTVLAYVPAPTWDADGPLQMQLLARLLHLHRPGSASAASSMAASSRTRNVA